MEYILNKTPIRTSNHFNINDIKLNLDIAKTDFNKYEINNCNYEEKILDNYTSKIGLDLDKYYNIDLDIDENIKDTVYIYYNFTKENNYLASKININLKNNCTSNIIIKYKSDCKSINCSSIVVNAKENSKSNITILNSLNDDSMSFISIENYEDVNSNVNINFIDLGGSIRLSNYYSLLEGIDSLNNFNNIYIGRNQDIIDMNYYVKNISKNTKGNILSNGVLSDYANKSFKGTIDFIKGSSGSISEEKENCIMLSDTCKSKSLPMLLCHEEDVQGAHGVSTGKIDENKLFYLMSKGISKNKAIKMIVHANFNEIISKIDDENIRNEIISLIDEKI